MQLQAAAQDVHDAAMALVVAGSARPDIDGMVRERHPLLSASECEQVVRAVRSKMAGLGALDDLLDDEEITDVFVNGPGPVFVERGGAIFDSGVRIGRSELDLLIERVVAPLGRRVDRSQPFVDARLPSGSRVHIAVAPVAVDGPYITIRRFRTRPVALAEFGHERVGELRDAVARGANIIVSGGTGAGKTTLLNALAAHLASDLRVVTIEDAAELHFDGAHVVRLESRPANAEAAGEVPIRELVRQALRMRPDRLILGEVRGAEAFDMLQAMNTGHEGSMTTCHANGPAEAMLRVGALAQQAGIDWPLDAILRQIQSTVDLLVHVKRGPGGRRYVSDVVEPAKLGPC